MAFKVEKSNFDWDVEIPIIGKEETEIVECTRVMNSKTYGDFLKHLNKIAGERKEDLKETKEKIKKDPDQGIILVIKQIDYLYGKGLEWWQENVEPSVILQIKEHLIDYTIQMGQKKS
jgi:vacuolar-type H+-ATPase subunit F/Vma7